ncbi:hypothetical protein NG800_016665 [Epilithonimonas ginsengisoli]|uniref:DUF4297 domain-containing protein n=1 Tax=Epilithonimonas ginsengisoli TaxID=1245592 RepID=A0ABU4JM07_9FLAO|nr:MULTISPECIES: hypothetical protein [Chryseobacterium group]MBV6881586.1 hypothetical protein [Epilithonimonas sp. FP105]MDW8550563.1 hypothetical protein [Epilithonimonas ginsengisoli]OAH69631.1 hypothetical protein AXA65_14550 [Chryseobacterium sp. FP211-J200]
MSKKLLIREIFEKGRKDSGKDSKSGIALYLSLYFYDEWKFEISERTFVRYYDAFLIDDEDKNIDTQVLDKMSQYLEFKDFKDFCKTETFTKINQDSSRTSVSVRIDDEDDPERKHPNITVNITTNPILKLQEFFAKQSGFGVIGLLIFGGFFTNNYFKKEENPAVKFAEVKNDELKTETPAKEIITWKENEITPRDQDVKEEPPKEEKLQCMFWDGKEYIPAHCSDTENGLIALDRKLVDNFKKITTPDTITSIKNVWYSKHQNVVEFFTADGVNPENGKELHELSQHMLDKYIKRE